MSSNTWLSQNWVDFYIMRDEVSAGKADAMVKRTPEWDSIIMCYRRGNSRESEWCKGGELDYETP